MSDYSQGPNWWQAADGRWYPPELHPDYQATPTPPVAPAGQPDAASTQNAQQDAPGDGNWKWLMAAAVAAVCAVIGGLFALTGGGDSNVQLAGASPSPQADTPDGPTPQPDTPAQPDTPVDPTADPETPADPNDPPNSPQTDPTEPPVEPSVDPDTPTAAAIDVDPSAPVGDADNPAAVGTRFAFNGDQTAGIVSIEFGDNLMISPDSPGAPSGQTYVVIVSEHTYYGGEMLSYISAFTEVEVDGIRIDTWDGDCYLDYLQALTSVDIGYGLTIRTAGCWTIPDDELDSMLVVLHDYDTEHFYAAAATATADAPDVSQQPLTATGPGTPSDPLAHGTAHEFAEYTVAVTRTFDPDKEGTMASYSTIPDGQVVFAVDVDITYNGSEPETYIPINVHLVGDRVHSYYESGCFLDDDVYDYPAFETDPGVTITNTYCFNVPSGEVDNLQIYIRGDFDESPVAYELEG